MSLIEKAKKMGIEVIGVEVPPDKKIKSQDLVTEFIADCRERGLHPSSIRRYSAHLKHFVVSFPDGLPWEWDKIEWFLNRVIRKKDARPEVKKSLQALYKYLGRKDYGNNPIPPGKVGRPRKIAPPSDGLSEDKLGRGGSDNPIRVEFHIFIHETGG